VDLAAEWLEADGAGGFASGTVRGERTRRYHALLLTALTPPTSRMILVNGIEAWVDDPAGRTFLTTQRYAPDVVYPNGAERIGDFTPEPWPCWRYRLPNGATLTQEIVGSPSGTVLRWTSNAPCRLSVRPLLSGRDLHATHHENPIFAFGAEMRPGAVTWRPYPGVPAVTASGNFAYAHEPAWYRNFLYAEERDRGLDCLEDLASPGLFHWDLGDPALLLLQSGVESGSAAAIIEAERTRRAGLSRRDRAAAQYVVRRGAGLSVIAGYPWFTDWGRDTFIAMRGLLLARGRLDEAGRILREWAGAVSEGMLPNRFPDRGQQPEYNAVDASLWFVVTASEYLARVPADAPALHPAMEAVLAGYAAGTRYGIGLDADGLLRSGADGVALTWMDARVEGRVVTPRRGKPVEVQALWINALHAGATWSPRWAELARRAHASFQARFPNPVTSCLFDVLDPDDAAIRPNQIFAVGGLPLQLLPRDQARLVVDLVERELLTPLGLRTLAPSDPAYVPHYRGGARERDCAYHQGAAWPWLLGPFVEAWLRVRDFAPEAKAEARARFLAPLLAHLDTAGLGHVSELTDGDPPHRPCGCPFQAWSLGELIRIEALVG
jgi:glycogen debranching enzyme